MIISAQSHPPKRIAQAWRDIEAWLMYIFAHWIKSGMFIGRQEEDRVDGFNGVMPFLSAVSKPPELTELLLAPRSRQKTLGILLFCWTMEGDEWFMKQKQYTPNLTAASPFANLALVRARAAMGPKFEDLPPTFDGQPENIAGLPGFDWVRTLEMICDVIGRTPADNARTALTLIRNHERVSPTVLCAHLEILNLIAIVPGCGDALLAQHAVRDVTRILAALTTSPYDAEFAPKVTQCIAGCIAYLETWVPTKDGYGNVRMALLAGVLPALLRCSPWLSKESEGLVHWQLMKIFNTIALYTVYPSVLRPLLVSARKIEELGLADHGPIGDRYLRLMQLVGDRLAMVRPEAGADIDLSVKCDKCGKPDTDANFKACSGCFLVSYCSEECQQEDWGSHEKGCQAAQGLREEGDSLPMLPEDFAYLFQFAMALVNRHRAEIVRVWKEEQPARTPLISFDFSEDPNGVMVVGEMCLETLPGKTARTGIFVPDLDAVIDAEFYFRARWLEVMTRPVYDEDALGKYPLAKWMFIGVNEEFREDGGTVLERLIKSVESGFDYGLSGPPIS
ncbi:hypothetical protein DFH09DRAFT_1104275 [Mycena vulgaris]|nr:hypothetical protein DFH09DRAFT_1104275 [Mycena vulgaris]